MTPTNFKSVKRENVAIIYMCTKYIGYEISPNLLKIFFCKEDNDLNLCSNAVNDKKIIKVANKAGIIMAFTGTRHFKH